MLSDFKEFEEHEQAVSITCLRTDDDQEHFLVGTGIVRPGETMPRRGRVIAYSYAGETDGRPTFRQRDEFEVRGAAFSLAPLSDGLFGVAVNQQVFVLSYTSDERFALVASWGGSFLATSLVARGDLLVVGDQLRSIVLLQFDRAQNALSEIAREHHTYGVTAVEALADDLLIGADADSNLMTVQRAAEATAHGRGDDELAPLGLYHFGDQINKFAHGTLVPAFAGAAADDAGLQARLLLATLTGAIYVLADLSAPTAKLLSDLERNLRKYNADSAIGRLDHAEWRAYASAHRKFEARGFIDGEYIEQFADLPDEVADAVLAGANEHERIEVSLSEVRRIVESVERLH